MSKDKALNAQRMLCYAKSLQSCPTLSDPIDGSPPGSSVHGSLQARTLEWVAIAFSGRRHIPAPISYSQFSFLALNNFPDIIDLCKANICVLQKCVHMAGKLM